MEETPPPPLSPLGERGIEIWKAFHQKGCFINGKEAELKIINLIG
jgi:hypothetical protein